MLRQGNSGLPGQQSRLAGVAQVARSCRRKFAKILPVRCPGKGGEGPHHPGVAVVEAGPPAHHPQGLAVGIKVPAEPPGPASVPDGGC
ncbi:hypothetical protein NHF46_06540 [Arthrobacter alpinus]|nr:hypothetical protein [Arthrobacter alpinus]